LRRSETLEDRKILTLRMKQASIRKMRTDRTTKLLITILCLFLLSEFPQVNYNNSIFGNVGSCRIHVSITTMLPMPGPKPVVKILNI
jgi:hypothetical protein